MVEGIIWLKKTKFYKKNNRKIKGRTGRRNQVFPSGRDLNSLKRFEKLKKLQN